MADLVDPMKRSSSLQPLSREHHTALTLAKACEQAGDKELVGETCQRALQTFSNGLDPHFQFDEQSLLPLLLGAATHPLVERTLTDHQQLRVLLNDLQQNDAGALGSYGKRLLAHVRFEERELLPVLESLL
jgi:hypothetical protein